MFPWLMGGLAVVVVFAVRLVMSAEKDDKVRKQEAKSRR
jgi:hypothetical protein